MNELDIINNYLKKLASRKNDHLKLSDDVFEYKNKTCITVDTYVEGKHFFYNDNPKRFIPKIFRSAISDLICKNVIPDFYFLSLALGKKNASKSFIDQLYKSFKNEQKKFKCYLAGGDIVNSQRLTITIIFVGKYKKNIFRRSKATAGQDLYVTGHLGDADVGLNILKKKINLKKNNNFFINRFYYPKIQSNFVNCFDKIITSSIDISDGLIKDVTHILNTSKVGAKINIDALPISNLFIKAVKENKIKIQNHVFAGDDYQILFTAKKNARIKINNLSIKKAIKITRIGTITKQRKLFFSTNKSNCKLNYKKMGYIHNFN